MPSITRTTATDRGTKSGLTLYSQLSLIENSYNFLNQSLRHYRKAARNLDEWPFALLHFTQTIELMLKHVLRKVHPLLVYEDVDKPKHTVSLDQALRRLEAVGSVKVEDKEQTVIRKAADTRNRIAHFEFELNKYQCKTSYAQLFEFVHFFHHKYRKQEVYIHIAKNLWPT
jgi:HEPN domain-containing protein